LSYLIFGFVCLTSSSADTRGIAKYARTYIRHIHTHAHTQKGTKEKKVGKTTKKEVGSGKKERSKKERTKREKREENERKGGRRRNKKEIKQRGRGMCLGG